MARKKTPPHIVALIERHIDTMNWIDEVLRVKTTVPPEQQADHVRNKGMEYWEGVADGTNNTLENAMHTYGCYAGFQHVGPRVENCANPFNPIVGPDHPDYKGWRRHYIVRG
jgi:hypothetical protein